MKKAFPVFALLLALYTLLMFRVVLPADAVIHAGDHNYGLMAFYKTELPGSLIDGFWRSFPLLGRVGHMPPTWTLFVLSLLPIDLFMDWIYGLNLFLASLFLFGFLRLRSLSPLSAAFGALSAFWLGSNLTLVLPGHLEKFAVLVFASASLLALEMFLQKPGIRRALVAGGALGFMFLHQADLALFFALPLGAYLLFGLLTRRPPMAWRKLAWMALPALLLVSESYVYSMQTQVRGVEVLEKGSPAEKWAFATQWSWPPAESLDLIAPGYWGWLSGHPEAPYHGVMGGSEAWPNFKNESQYLGILPLALALWAAVLGLIGIRRKSSPPPSAELLFWSGITLIAFALACGKYTPLYGLFYKLPLINAIRNPNKFLQVFQWTLGILSAFGAEALLRGQNPRRFRLGFALGLALLAAGLGLASLLTDPSDPLQLRRFADSPWQAAAAGILAARRSALLHAALFSTAAAALFYLCNGTRRAPLFAAIAAVALDGILLGSHYLQPMDTSFVKQNPVADFLKKDLGLHRVAVLDPGGIYGLFLTHVFPAHNIPFANLVAAPRLQQEYRDYFESLDGNEFRRWQDFAVKYVLVSRAMWTQMRTNPGVDRLLVEVMAYQVGPEAHVVLKLRNPGERFRLQPDSDAPSDAASGAVLSSEATGTGFKLRVRVDTPEAFLRLADKWDPSLFARIDGGAPLPLERSGLLFAGIRLPQGTHAIEVAFRKPALGRRMQATGILLTLGALFSLCPQRRRRVANTGKWSDSPKSRMT